VRIFALNGTEKGSRQLSELEEVRGRTIAWSPDMHYLAAGTEDGRNKGTVRILDASTTQLKEAVRFTGHDDGITGVAFPSNNRFVLSVAGRDPMVRLWDRNAPARPTAEWKIPNTPAVALGVAPGGEQLAVASRDRLYLWDIRGPKYPLLGPVSFSDGPIGESLAWSPDGEMLVRGSSRGLDLVSARTRKVVQHYDLPWAVNAVAFAPDGHHLAAGLSNGIIYILRLKALPAT
jgi:WD40 repeat protein